MPFKPAYTKSQILHSIEIMEMLSDGNLMYGIVESKKDVKNKRTIPWEEAKKGVKINGKSGSFASLSAPKKSQVVREGAGCLFAKRDIKRAIKVVDYLITETKVKNPDMLDATQWGKLTKDVKSMKSIFQATAPVPITS